MERRDFWWGKKCALLPSSSFHIRVGENIRSDHEKVLSIGIRNDNQNVSTMVSFSFLDV
jgi:hypothetical protein